MSFPFAVVNNILICYEHDRRIIPSNVMYLSGVICLRAVVVVNMGRGKGGIV